MEYTSKMTVTADKTARHMGSGDLEVLATPCMVSLMENAAMLCIASSLESGFTTVGTAINVTHDKATALGKEVSATAALINSNGRAYEFEVTAYEGGTVIGKGTHTRFAVNAEKFLSRL